MFDGLKDRLSSFRRDAEEEIDEAADEAAADEAAERDSQSVETDSEAETAVSEPTESVDTSEPSPLGDDAEPPEQAVPTPEAAEPTATDDDTAGSSDTDAAESSDVDAVETAGSNSDATDTSDATVEPAVTDAESDEPASIETDTDEVDAETTDARRPTRLNRPTTPPEPDEESSDEDLGFGTRAKLFATGQSLIEAAELEEPLFELEMALLESDVEMSVTEAILDRLREELTGATRAQVKGTGLVVEEALAESLREVISVGQFDFDERVAAADKPLTIVFTGVNGVGKTTTIAKLARYFEERGLSTVLANGDTYRAGANQQLTEHAEKLGKKIIAHDQGSDPAAVLYDAVEYAEANDIDIVLGDTAGRLHTSNDLMAQLEKIDRVVDPDMTIFVDEAVAGQDATNRAREFDNAAAIDGAILAKADADSQGGAAISIAHVTGKPVLFLGTGQGYDDIERFDPDVLVDRLLGEET